jgi:hypothetical protein
MFDVRCQPQKSGKVREIFTNIKSYVLTIVFFGELLLRRIKPVCKISVGGRGHGIYGS